MKARIKFRKYGVMKFIGHLDVMRYFQKAMRRADIPVAFTSGYSPHMIMSFAQPLGVGITSDGEYLDVELTERITSARALEQLNRVMVEGMEVIRFLEISGDKKMSGMSVTAAADYLVFPKGEEMTEEFQSRAKAFFSRGEIIVQKQTKRSERTVDIKPMIYDFQFRENCIFLKLAAGSEQNLKPKLLMEAFFSQNENLRCPLQFHRTEIYARGISGETGMAKFYPLESFGASV